MYEFDFSDRSAVAAMALDELSGSQYWLDDRVYSRAFGSTVASEVADLLSIAMGCYAADRLSPRGLAWHRDFVLRIDVADPQRWRGVGGDLSGFLKLLTDDEWNFEFVEGRRARVSELQGTLFPELLRCDASVGLFSGGLDSLVGAARVLESSDRQLVLLGARSSPVIGRDQHRQAIALRLRYPGKIIEIGVPLHLRESVSLEKTQRTRSFLYLALGVAAAITGGASKVEVFENGYGAYNPRLDEHQLGTQANRGTHPYVLARFARLMARANLSVDVALPHQGESKAEHVAHLPNELLHLVSLTSSCDSYPLRRSGVTHCGRCGSCILRRQSLLAAGLEGSDRDDYEFEPFEHPVAAGEICVRSARQAWLFGQLASADRWSDIEALWPSFGLDPDIGWPERALVLRLMATLHGEWEGIMDSHPRARSAFHWPESSAA